MKKLVVIVLVAGFANTLFAAWGFWDATRSYVQFHEKKSGTVQTNTYSLWDSGTGTYNGHDFGIFNIPGGDELVMLLYDTKTWKSDGGNVTGCEYFYTRYTNNLRPASPTFTSLGGGWLQDLGSGNQLWGNHSLTVNILETLNNSKTNVLEIYGQITGTTPSGTAYDNNNGDSDNYSATFVAMPEPASIILLLFGLGFMAFRK